MAFSGARFGYFSATKNRFYVWGCYTVWTDFYQAAYSTNLDVFDSRSERWISHPTGEPYPTGTLVGAGAECANFLYVYGGMDKYKECITGSLCCLDLEKFVWKELSPSILDGPKKKIHCGMILKEDCLILFGGVADQGIYTDELHIFNLTEGLWQCIHSTGTKPPPCAGFAFVKVSKTMVILFGGMTEAGYTDDLYTLDISNMNWTKVAHASGAPWPTKRKYFAACCLGMESGQAQVIIQGGEYENEELDDMWMLNITTMTWRKLSVEGGSLQRSYHSMGVIQITEDITELIIYGGLKKCRLLSETTIVRFEKQHAPTSGASTVEWKVTDIADSSQLATKERLQRKNELYNLSIWNTDIREMKHFNLIRYYNSTTDERKQLRILDDLSNDWENVAGILGFSSPEIEAIKMAGPGKTSLHCFRDVLTKWLKNSDNMPNSSHFPTTWTGVCRLLEYSKHSNTAESFKEAVAASNSDLRGNYFEEK